MKAWTWPTTRGPWLKSYWTCISPTWEDGPTFGYTISLEELCKRGVMKRGEPFNLEGHWVITSSLDK